jgi:hypothetical protein
VFFTTFWCLVVFALLHATFETRGNFFVVFIQKLIQRLGCSRARTFFERRGVHLTIIVRYSLSFNLRNLERSWGRSPFFLFFLFRIPYHIKIYSKINC